MSAPEGRASAPLDNVCEVETPEGVALELHAAGPIVRAVAWAIDLAIRVVLYALLFLLLLSLGRLGAGIGFLILFAGEWLYPVAFEVLRDGQTPGKRSMRIATVRDDGTPVRLRESLLRNLLRTVDFLPSLYLTGLVAMALSPRFQRLGDLAAGTLVVFSPVAGPLAALPEVRPRPLPVALELEEQRAVIAFGQRVPNWTPERARELAERAQPLVSMADDPVEALLGVAAWLIGRRG